MMDELEDFLKENDIEIAALTIPKAKALEVANILVNNGVTCDLEFCTYRSESSGGCHCGKRSSVGESDEVVL